MKYYKYKNKLFRYDPDKEQLYVFRKMSFAGDWFGDIEDEKKVWVTYHWNEDTVNKHPTNKYKLKKTDLFLEML